MPVLEAELLADPQRLMLANVLLVLLIIGFSAGIAAALVRRSMRQRVEEERLAAMGTATARILHQVKNPLQTLLLHAEVLEDEALSAEPSVRREVSRSIIDEAERISQLLEELSAYASGIARRLRLGPVALGDLLMEIARSQAADAERHGIRLVVDAPGDPVIRADAYYLRQAVENLVRNACEALAEMENAATPRVELSARWRAGEVVVEVRDNGPGIEAERIASILEPFITTKSSGMGLGLPICREIVEGHGGRLEIRSRPGTGTVIALLLPGELAVPPEMLENRVVNRPV